MSESRDNPLVSVIIPSYNHETYIEECIRSVLAQSYSPIELIVVDDGSSDASVEIITRLQQDNDFYFKTQANQGLACTLNDCIALAKGSLIAPFASDDVMLPERIAVQVAYMRDKPEVGICAGNIEQIDGSGQPLIRRNKERLFRSLDFDALFSSEQAGSPAPTLLFRREALEKVGGFDPKMPVEDLLIELKIARAGYRVDVLPDVLARYRVHETNTHKNYRLMLGNVLKIYQHFSDHPDYEKVCARFRNSMLLKCAKSDPELFVEILRGLPLRYWNRKTFRALLRRCIYR